MDDRQRTERVKGSNKKTDKEGADEWHRGATSKKRGVVECVWKTWERRKKKEKRMKMKTKTMNDEMARRKKEEEEKSERGPSWRSEEGIRGISEDGAPWKSDCVLDEVEEDREKKRRLRMKTMKTMKTRMTRKTKQGNLELQTRKRDRNHPLTFDSFPFFCRL